MRDDGGNNWSPGMEVTRTEHYEDHGPTLFSEKLDENANSYHAFTQTSLSELVMNG